MFKRITTGLLALAIALPAFAAKPNVWFNQADIDRLASDCATYQNAINAFNGVKGSGNAWVNRTHSFFTSYPDIEWGTYATYPPRPSAWGDQSTKEFWQLGFAIHDLGLAYSLTEDTAYAATARDMLVGFADIYDQYPIEKHGVTFDASKIFVQRLDEAMLGVDVAFGYSCIKDFCTAAQQTNIEDNFLKEIVNCIYSASGQGANNYTCVMDECVAVVGYATGDAAIIDKALNGARATDGVYYLIDNWIEDDGSTKEGAMGYHLMGLRGICGIAEAARVAGTDVYSHSNNRLKLAMDYAVNFVFPDNVSPATHDGGNTDLTADYSGTSVYHSMYRAYGDDMFKNLIMASGSRLVSSQGKPEPSHYFEPLTADDVPDRVSMNFEYTGMSVLRSGKGDDQSYVLLDYGPFDFHGHLDKLNIVTYFSGAQMALDPGTFTYSDTRHATWSISSPAHNVVCVDMYQQLEEGGELHYMDTTYYNCQVMSASANTVANGVNQKRTLALMPRYMVDVFELSSATSHIYDWMYHNRGVLNENNPINASGGLLSANDGYRHIYVQKRGMMDTAPKASFLYFGAQVDLTLLPEDSTDFITANGLGSSANDVVPMVIARRTCNNTKYVALHDFHKVTEDGDVSSFTRMNETATALGVHVDGDGFNDYFVLSTSGTAEQTLRDAADGNEFFTFSGNFCHANNTGDTLYVNGTVTNFRLLSRGAAVTVLNGSAVSTSTVGSYVEYPAYTGTTGSMSGTVTDADDASQGVPGTVVELTGPATYYAATGSDGTYNLPILLDGSYTVTASHAGYVAQAVSGQAAGSTVDISLQITGDDPVISNLAAVYDAGKGIVTWSTDKPCNSQVNYGTTASYGQATAATSARVFDHRVEISGLSSGGSYYFQANSSDADGNAASMDGDAPFDAISAFSDNFEDGDLTGWTNNEPAKWQVLSGHGGKALYVNTGPSQALTAPDNYGTFTIDLDIRGASTSAYRNAGIVLGYIDANNYVFAEFAGRENATFHGIFTKKDGVITKVAGTGAAGVLEDTTTWHHVRVTRDAASGEINCYADDASTPLFNTVISDAPFASGKVGLLTDRIPAWFDNVEIVPYVRTDAFASVSGSGPASIAGIAGVTAVPNPGIDRFEFTWEQPQTGSTELTIFNGSGTPVYRYTSGTLTGGTVVHSWTPAASLPDGQYFYRITSSNSVHTGRLLLMR